MELEIEVRYDVDCEFQTLFFVFIDFHASFQSRHEWL